MSHNTPGFFRPLQGYGVNREQGWVNVGDHNKRAPLH